jgi:hypothetical protein
MKVQNLVFQEQEQESGTNQHLRNPHILLNRDFKYHTPGLEPKKQFSVQLHLWFSWWDQIKLFHTHKQAKDLQFLDTISSVNR